MKAIKKAILDDLCLFVVMTDWEEIHPFKQLGHMLLPVTASESAHPSRVVLGTLGPCKTTSPAVSGYILGHSIKTGMFRLH